MVQNSFLNSFLAAAAQYVTSVKECDLVITDETGFHAFCCYKNGTLNSATQEVMPIFTKAGKQKKYTPITYFTRGFQATSCTCNKWPI